MRRRALMAATVALAVLAGCSSGAAKGTISGRLMTVGGPLGNADQPLPGTVVLADSGGRSTMVEVGDDGAFYVHVAADSYSPSGNSPLFGDGMYECRAEEPVVVQASAPVTAEVDCAMK
jgi:hypothetical protein